MKLMISEILEKASNLSTKKEKIEFLRKHYTKQLHLLLMHVFDPSVKFLLPDTDPPYKPNPTNESQGMLYSEIRKFYLFCEGGHPTLKQNKREQLFVAMLENIDPADAKLMLHVKNKKLPYKGITPSLIQEAFGDYNG